jgi:hypothetical protein
LNFTSRKKESIRSSITQYDLTKPLEKGCTGEMNKYYLKNAERYVNPFYFPHTFPREKVNNRIIEMQL